MNKNQFVNEVYSKTKLTKKECRLCLDAILSVITDALSNGESVTLSNFGKFKVNEVKSKPMYSFKTKQTQIFSARRAPSFKASDNLKKKTSAGW